MIYSGDEFYDDEVTSGRAEDIGSFNADMDALLDDGEEPSEPEEPQAYHTYDLVTEPDGTITGTSETNDDNDDGYPDGRVTTWNVKYQNRESMLKRLSGGTHRGISGILVTVYLDGVEVKRA